jgi:hypothetical protein
MSTLANGGSVWTDNANGADAAALTPVVLRADGAGDLSYSVVGPADAELVDTDADGVFDLVLVPPTPAGTRVTALRDAAGNIIVF